MIWRSDRPTMVAPITAAKIQQFGDIQHQKRKKLWNMSTNPS